MVDVPLAIHSTLAGSVTADGRAVAGLRLVLRDIDGRAVGSAVTDADGGYRFEHVTAGEYTLTSATSASSPTLIAPDTTTVDLVLPPPQ